MFVTFLKELPEETKIENILSYDYSPDKIEIVGKNIYGYCEGKYHKTKYSNKFFETKLKVSATTRNWNTMMKIVDLLKQ